MFKIKIKSFLITRSWFAITKMQNSLLESQRKNIREKLNSNFPEFGPFEILALIKGSWLALKKIAKIISQLNMPITQKSN